MNATCKMLGELIGYGLLIGTNPEDAAKLIPHKNKMVLLRFWNDYKETGDLDLKDRFEKKWSPVRKFIESHN